MKFLLSMFAVLALSTSAFAQITTTPGCNRVAACPSYFCGEAGQGLGADPHNEMSLYATSGEGLTGSVIYKAWLSGSLIGTFHTSVDDIDNVKKVYQVLFSQGSNAVVAGTNGYEYDIHITEANMTNFTLQEKFGGRAPASANFITPLMGQISGSGRCSVTTPGTPEAQFESVCGLGACSGA